MARRSREVAVDTGLVVLAAAFGVMVQQDLLFAAGAAHLAAVGPLDLAAGLVCLSSTWWLRRRAPVAFTLLGVAASLVSSLAGAVPLIGAYTVASRRPWPVALATGVVVALNAGLVQVLVRPLPTPLPTALGGVLLTAVAVGWGLYSGSRRTVVELLREQVEAQAELARRAERARIAREMHDTLAHRLSLLAVHGGALAYRAADVGPEVAALAETVRDQAHHALDELRSAVSALRDPDAGSAGLASTPTAGDLEALVAETAATGHVVTLEQEGPVDGLPAATGATVYRVVQEALTNSRRHGRERAVRVRLAVGDDEVSVVVEDRGDPAGVEEARPPSPGTGLVGLRERVALARGRFEAGPGADGGFVVRAVLPRRPDGDPVPRG